MWHGARVAVIVPAFCEERLLGRTLAAIPSSVDLVVVVDDASSDRTAEVTLGCGDARVVLERHAVNRGVGAAIATGYHRALKEGAEILVVMAGDNQMDPRDLNALVEPVASGRADYVKGNRFVHPEVRRMPWARRLGGKLLSALTRAAFALDVDDTQCGFTALSSSAASAIDLCDLWPRYGYPNDLLGLLAAAKQRVLEVPVRPVYGDEASGVRSWHVVTIAAVVLRRAWRKRRATRAGRASPRSAAPARAATPATSRQRAASAQ